MVTLILVVTAIAGVLIPLASFSDAKKHALMRGLSGLLTAVFATSSVVCVVQRGATHSGLALLAGTLLFSGLFLLIMVRATPCRFEDRAAVVLATRENANRWLVRIWCVLMAVLSLIPLGYAGALAGDPSLALSKIVAFGQFNPLTEERPISLGQCFVVREPAATNPVIPCSIAHRSEIVDAIDISGTRKCPDINSLPHEGLELRIATVGPFDGVTYCLVQSVSPTRAWTGRIGMAYTP